MGDTAFVWWSDDDAIAPYSYRDTTTPQLGADDIKKYNKDIIGVFVTITWSSLEPTKNGGFNWTDFDKKLQSYTDQGFFIILMVWTGSDAPPWLYKPPLNLVPKVKTDDLNGHDVYPYYFDGGGIYKQRWYQMLDAVSNHIDALSTDIRKRVVIYQSAEGSTGDEGPYKGNVINNVAYNISRSDSNWIQLRRSVWKHLDTLYKSKSPLVHLMINCDPTDPEDSANWLKTKVTNVWRKASNAGHVYQLNGEAEKKQEFDTLINMTTTLADTTTKIRCRDEIGQYTAYSVAPKWFTYWTALSALYFGLDMWPNTGPYIKDSATNNPAYKIFTKYAGHKNAGTAPALFVQCVMDLMLQIRLAFLQVHMEAVQMQMEITAEKIVV